MCDKIKSVKLPKHIEAWDDEREVGNGVIVTLTRGWSFYSTEHLGVCGFDTVTEAREGTRKKNLYRCKCAFCKTETNCSVCKRESSVSGMAWIYNKNGTPVRLVCVKCEEDYWRNAVQV